jgi:hypothetical protein
MFRTGSARLRRSLSTRNPLQEYYMKNMDLLMDYYKKQRQPGSPSQPAGQRHLQYVPQVLLPAGSPRARDRLASRCLTSTSSV